MNNSKKIGVLLLGLGIVCLIISILSAFMVGGTIVPILFCSSILLNTAGVIFIRK